MGTLSNFNLEAIRVRYDLRSFVETGMGSGASIPHAQAARFDEIHEIEIVPELVHAARVKHRLDKRVHIHEGDSRTMLPLVIDQLPDGPCLFWLDAHMAGSDTTIYDGGADPDMRRRWPLEDEINVIRGMRRGMRDVLLCDDMRVYVDGPYGSGPVPQGWAATKGLQRGIDFIRQAYSSTHSIIIDYADHGYGYIFPLMTYEQVAGSL